jgi:hypothetical protein
MTLMIEYPQAYEISTDENKDSGRLSRSRKTRIEILNSEGNIVGIVTKRSLVKMLNLEQGFYLVREKNKNSRVINSGMMLL